jgi:ribonuclease D
MPAYIIFGNQVLMDVAHHRPTTEEEMKRIKGMGPEKIGKYGDAIIEIVSAPTSTKRVVSTKSKVVMAAEPEIEEDESSRLPSRRYLKKIA